MIWLQPTVLVLLAVGVFWARRNLVKVKRFWSKEMTSRPKSDGNIILYFEVVLMGLFLTMNATDHSFQAMDAGNPISQFIAPLFASFSESSLHLIERTAWCLHISGILLFLNYLFSFINSEIIYCF